MSATDDYKIALNVMARVGVNSPDFLKEYAKAKATLHQMDSYNQLQTQQQAQGQANPIQNIGQSGTNVGQPMPCLLYTSPSPRDGLLSRMPSSA